MKKIDKDKLDLTYGIFKFRVPSKEEQFSAMGLSGESTLFKKMISHQFQTFYETISAPDIGDWLMNHKEYGQTYDDYMRSGIIPVDSKKHTIYLAPLSFGNKGNLDEGFIKSLFLMSEAYFYGMKVKILEKKIDLMKYDIDVRQFDDNKVQINANQILTYLCRELPSDAHCLIAFTDKDLYNSKDSIKSYEKTENKNIINPYINFCYGISSARNRIGVFSFARYDPLFYSNIVIRESPKQQEKIMKYFFILLKRACKVIISEACRMFGLKNCIFFSCIMNGFNSIEEFDNRPIEICPICLRKLYTNISLKSSHNSKARVNNPLIIFDRLVKLRDTLFENFYGIFEEEVIWYNARIDTLKIEI